LSNFRSDRKIQAIKAVRSLTGMGLTESKAFVEKFYPFRLTD
jgi:ribosomal protein L7/L12